MTVSYGKKSQMCVRRLKRNKSPGNDGIAAEMIKAGGEKLLGKIHSLCNQAWVLCQVPKEWLKSVLVPIPKKGGALECKNYRTISLISHIGKKFMMILQKRLDAQLEAHIWQMSKRDSERIEAPHNRY